MKTKLTMEGRSALRVPVSLLERIKVAANKCCVPYQSLIKTWLAEKTGTS